MQQIEKLVGLKVSDFTEFVPNLRQAYKLGSDKYIRETPVKLRMLDCLVALSFALFLVQAVYGVLICRDPFNSFIAGTFCAMGIFALSVSLRIQLASVKDFDASASKMVFEFLCGGLLMFFASFLLMG